MHNEPLLKALSTVWVPWVLQLLWSPVESCSGCLPEERQSSPAHFCLAQLLCICHAVDGDLEGSLFGDQHCSISLGLVRTNNFVPYAHFGPHALAFSHGTGFLSGGQPAMGVPYSLSGTLLNYSSQSLAVCQMGDPH